MNMKRIMLLVVSMIIVSCAMAQSKIIGVSNYVPRDDSIIVSITELNYLISHSHIVCSKIDTLEDGSMIKTVEIETNDSGFRLIGAYVESEAFFPKDCVHTVENCQWILKCEYALVDDGELYESYMLDSIGRKYFQKLLNMTPLVCIDMQK